MPRGTFPKPGQLKGTGITRREHESLLGSLRLIQALTWLPEPALPQPSSAGEGRIASVGKVRLLKCEKLRKEGRDSGEAVLFPLSQRLEKQRFVRAEEWVHGITWLGKKEEWSSHSIISPEIGSSGNTRGCCLKGENSCFRRSVKSTYFPRCRTPLLPPRLCRGLPSFQVRVPSQQAGGKPATFKASVAVACLEEARFSSHSSLRSQPAG